MAHRIFTVFFVSILSLGYLSIGLLPSGERRLASCVDPVAEANTIPLPSGLFGEIKDEALKKSTLDYYLFLTKVEMQALAGRQSMRAIYGLSDAPASALPVIAPFDPRANAFATGFLWGSFGDNQARSAFTVGSSLPSLTIPPYTAGIASDGAVKKPEGVLFPPYNQQAANQKVIYSPTVGTFLPSANSANHKIGTF
jgi:hypothetical protein